MCDVFALRFLANSYTYTQYPRELIHVHTTRESCSRHISSRTHTHHKESSARTHTHHSQESLDFAAHPQEGVVSHIHTLVGEHSLCMWECSLTYTPFLRMRGEVKTPYIHKECSPTYTPQKSCCACCSPPFLFIRSALPHTHHKRVLNSFVVCSLLWCVCGRMRGEASESVLFCGVYVGACAAKHQKGCHTYE